MEDVEDEDDVAPVVDPLAVVVVDDVPEELLALALVRTGVTPLVASCGRVEAAAVWALIGPETVCAGAALVEALETEVLWPDGVAAVADPVEGDGTPGVPDAVETVELDALAAAGAEATGVDTAGAEGVEGDGVVAADDAEGDGLAGVAGAVLVGVAAEAPLDPPDEVVLPPDEPVDVEGDEVLDGVVGSDGVDVDGLAGVVGAVLLGVVEAPVDPADEVVPSPDAPVAVEGDEVSDGAVGSAGVDGEGLAGVAGAVLVGTVPEAPVDPPDEVVPSPLDAPAVPLPCVGAAGAEVVVPPVPVDVVEEEPLVDGSAGAVPVAGGAAVVGSEGEEVAGGAAGELGAAPPAGPLEPVLVVEDVSLDAAAVTPRADVVGLAAATRGAGASEVSGATDVAAGGGGGGHQVDGTGVRGSEGRRRGGHDLLSRRRRGHDRIDGGSAGDRDGRRRRGGNGRYRRAADGRDDGCGRGDGSGHGGGARTGGSGNRRGGDHFRSDNGG